MSREPEASALRLQLESMLGRIEAVAALRSGTGGRSILVTTRAGRFVAKRFSADSPVLLGPAEQFALLEEIAPLAIAPRPAAVDAAAGILVTEFVTHAQELAPRELRRKPRIVQLARALHRLHSVRPAVPAYAPLAYAARYLGMAGGLECLSPVDRKRYGELVELAESLDLGPACLCHNDLTAANLLFRDAPVLIDFDFAALASPWLDLASLTVMNQFGKPEIAMLLGAYYDGGAPFSGAEFARVERLQRLLAHFWSLASRDRAAAIVGQYRIEDD